MRNGVKRTLLETEKMPPPTKPTSKTIFCQIYVCMYNTADAARTESP